MAIFGKNAEFRRINLDKTMLRLIKRMKLEFKALFYEMYVIRHLEERTREGVSTSHIIELRLSV